MSASKVVPSMAIWCPACSTQVDVPAEPIDREGRRCPACGSTARDRYMLLATLGAVDTVSAASAREDVRLIGISDAVGVSGALTRMFGFRYRNYRFGRAPLADLVSTPPALDGAADIITCADVLEHVPRPVDRAFASLRRILRPGGVLVLTVPYHTTQPHAEHFPELVDGRVEQAEDESFRYVGHDAAGVEHDFDSLVFHGPAGVDLEHRVFSRDSLESGLLGAGFVDVRPLVRDHDWAGAGWQPWSRVWTARAPG